MKEYIAIEHQTENGGYIETVSELIRCKDCMYFKPRSIYGHGLCDIHCNGVGESEVVNETYYCCFAERKES